MCLPAWIPIWCAACLGFAMMIVYLSECFYSFILVLICRFFFHFISLRWALLLLLLLVVVVDGGGVGSNGGNRNDSGCVSMFLFLFRYAFFHPSSCMTKLKRSSNVYQTIIKLMHALNIVYYGNKWYIVSFFLSSS